MILSSYFLKFFSSCFYFVFLKHFRIILCIVEDFPLINQFSINLHVSNQQRLQDSKINYSIGCYSFRIYWKIKSRGRLKEKSYNSPMIILYLFTVCIAIFPFCHKRTPHQEMGITPAVGHRLSNLQFLSRNKNSFCTISLISHRLHYFLSHYNGKIFYLIYRNLSL